jgi:hypothetical protein
LKSGAGFAGTMTTSTLMASITATAAVASGVLAVLVVAGVILGIRWLLRLD